MVTAKKSPAKKTVAAPVRAPATAVAPKAATKAAPKAAPSAALKKAPAKTAISKVKATPSAVRPEVSPEQRHNYIEVAAFYVAQRRGFAPGNPLDDWATAEIEVDQLIVSGHFSR